MKHIYKLMLVLGTISSAHAMGGDEVKDYPELRLLLSVRPKTEVSSKHERLKRKGVQSIEEMSGSSAVKTSKTVGESSFLLPSAEQTLGEYINKMIEIEFATKEEDDEKKELSESMKALLEAKPDEAITANSSSAKIGVHRLLSIEWIECLKEKGVYIEDTQNSSALAIERTTSAE